MRALTTWRTILAALTISCCRLRAQEIEHLLAFQGCSKVVGRPGEVKTMELFASLETVGPTGRQGIQGWTIAVTASNGTLRSIDLEGLRIPTLHDHDGDEATPAIEGELDLADASLATAELLEGPVRTVVSTVVLHPSGRVYVGFGGHAIARIVVEVPIAEDGSFGNLEVAYIPSIDGEPGTSYLFREIGRDIPDYRPCVTQVRPEGTRFHLSVVPVGADPPAEGDFIVEGTVPPGDFLLEAEVLLTGFHPFPGVDGAQSWAVSLRHDSPCMEIESFTLDGVVVSTIFDHDGDPTTPDIDPHPLDLKDADFRVLQKAVGFHPDEDARGLVSAVVPHFQKKMVLHLNATDPLLRVVYRIPVPQGVTKECRVAFVDGLRGAGTPIKNSITWMGESVYLDRPFESPSLHQQGMVVRLTGGEIPFQRGDAASDGVLDLSDAIFILDNLFLGGPRPACRKTGDVDDNGSVEITDPIYLLGFLFLGGPPPQDARLCRLDPTPDALTCFAYVCE